MATKPLQPSFPAAPALAMLSAVALGLALAAAWLVPWACGTGARDARVAVWTAAAVVWATGLLGLAPVILAGPHGVMPTVRAYFLGAASRFVLSLTAAAGAVKLGGLPAKPLMVTLLALYLPLLFVETALVARYLWRKDALANSAGA